MIEYIYVIENLKNGKFYLGRTNDPAQRKRAHFSELKRNGHGNPRLQAAFNKYGLEAFRFSVVDIAYGDEIEAKEAEWFAAFDQNKSFLYNCHFQTFGGPIISRPHSPESAEKISEAIRNGTRRYVFSILDERYYDQKPYRYLANKHGVGSSTLIRYVPEWEALRGVKMPTSFQVEGSRDRVGKFVELFDEIGPAAMRHLEQLNLTRKSLKKYLPEFGVEYGNVLIRPAA